MFETNAFEACSEIDTDGDMEEPEDFAKQFARLVQVLVLRTLRKLDCTPSKYEQTMSEVQFEEKGQGFLRD